MAKKLAVGTRKARMAGHRSMAKRELVRTTTGRDRVKPTAKRRSNG